MSERRYILEPYKGMNTRYRCPGCQHREKTFTLYIDTETNLHVASSVGRCNRESNCGYHYSPKQYFQDNKDITEIKPFIKPKAKLQFRPAVSLISINTFKGSLKGYEGNYFVKYLIKLFGPDIARQLISKYFIGTSKYWPGAAVFWQIDKAGKIKTGKIMLYNPTTGKRVKDPFNHITWVHKAIKQPEFNLQQCFFGEHLINQFLSKPVAIVESEKTAIIASVYLPGFIWVAVGSLNNLSADKCQVLKGRKIVLFPDLNGFDKWGTKAKELSRMLTYVNLSNLLERKATEAEKKQGFDLADYLIRFDHREFTLLENLTIPYILTYPNIQNEKFSIEPAKPQELQNLTIPYKFRGQDIADLEIFFSETTEKRRENDLKTPIRLNQCSTITNVSLFIESHFATLKANHGNRTFLPYLSRLRELKQILQVP